MIDKSVYLISYICSVKDSPVKQHIIETATRLFYQNGYNLTGINEIIKEAKIAKATLYNHFKSKDEICQAYLIHKNSLFLMDIDEYTNRVPEGIEQCLSIFDFLFFFFQESEFNGCWCVNTISEIPRDNVLIRDEIQKQKQLFITFVRKLIDRAFTTNNDQQNELLAKQIYLLYEGAVSESNLHQEDWPIDSARELAKKLLS